MEKQEFRNYVKDLKNGKILHKTIFHCKINTNNMKLLSITALESYLTKI